MNIYVGNLHFGVSENDLKQLLAEFTSVLSIKIISDRDSGKSKGYGFIEMDNDSEATKAIETFNGTMLNGRTLVMKESTPRT